ncbi:flagellar filament capping protein FliD [Nitratiruptor sp. SB155-2]|uniref:flagellar filament capping protein FliD n=1 Tax=Nitratiruptor sp. (strain SB155-2) TaxID=387092 RepID=UPI0001586DF1|nr:flagellar filament capping protein FliD [Nitratiruptor sp. SB155-2]BAF69756.1 flagellar hook-associated protein 2 FliD [Nitratiruptor sp. SB155-2]
MAGEMSITGLTNTGFDYNAYLDKLAQLKSIPLQQMQAQQQKIIAKSTAIVQVKSALSDFLSPLTTLQDSSIYDKLDATLSNDNIASVSVDGTKAQPGSYNLEVVQLAKASSFLISPAQNVTDPNAAFTDSGTLTINYKLDGTATSLDIDYTGKSLADIVNEINQSADLEATMINSGSSTSPDYRILVTSKKTGIDNEITGISDSDGDNTTGFDTNSDPSTDPRASYTTQAAQNAQIKLNGIIIENATNTFSDVLSGVEITAQEVGTSSLTVAKDFSDIENSLDTIVSAYNTLKDTINQVTAKGQPLQGEGSLSRITTTIFNKLNSVLGQYGLLDTTGEGEAATGKLVLKKDALESLFNDPNFDAKTTFTNMARDLESYVNNYTDNMTLINERYLEQSDRIQKEIEEKSERIQKEIDALRTRYAKINVYLSQLQDTRLRIENFTKALLNGGDK